MKISIKNALFFTFFALLSLNKSIKAKTYVPQVNRQPKVVIFIFADALVSNRSKMAGKVIDKVGLWNSLWSLGTALKSQPIMFEALYDKFGHQTGSLKVCDTQDPHDELPIPFVDWLLGKNPAQVCTDIKNGLNSYKFPGGKKEKEFIFKVLDIIFNATEMAETFSPVGDTVKLIERISSGPVHPKLILAANCNDLVFDHLRTLPAGLKTFPLFNNVYISGRTKLLVEDPNLYKKIIKDNGAQASDYLIITSNKQAAAAANSVGMQTVYSADNLYSVGKDYCKSANLIKK